MIKWNKKNWNPIKKIDDLSCVAKTYKMGFYFCKYSSNIHTHTIDHICEHLDTHFHQLKAAQVRLMVPCEPVSTPILPILTIELAKSASNDGPKGPKYESTTLCVASSWYKAASDCSTAKPLLIFCRIWLSNTSALPLSIVNRTLIPPFFGHADFNSGKNSGFIDGSEPPSVGKL